MAVNNTSILDNFYNIDENYTTSVAYFSMEFGIHQALKTYSGGLGYLTGSYMRSAYDLKQNIVGVGILWSYGYYDQTRNEDRTMAIAYRRKLYYFLKETGVMVSVMIGGRDVFVKAVLLEPEVFGSAPIVFLTTDIEENDFLSRTITHKLYENNEETRIAQEIVLGIGGFKALEALDRKVDIYHLNEGHAIPLAFSLFNKFGTREQVRKHMVFTTHTPEKAGNEEHDINKLNKMGFFDHLPIEKVRELTGITEDSFSLTLAALRLSKIANGVSKIHEEVSNEMWSSYPDTAIIIKITNAQNRRFWADKTLIRALDEHEDYEIIARKKHLKRILFDMVADQTGKMFDPDILTLVWSRRFAEYKRPGLIKYDFERFKRLIERTDQPIQVIWAGRPYPADSNAINIFNEFIHQSKYLKRIAVLFRYDLTLSRMLKQGADVWLNTPRITREASGTSGISACMNGAIHFSIADGWHPEFAKNGINSFTIPPCSHKIPIEEQDHTDNKNMMDILEQKIIPMYYNWPKEWVAMIKNSMQDIMPAFDSGRMAYEYYVKMYNYEIQADRSSNEALLEADTIPEDKDQRER
ncbi:MAG: alpha-glucan family phosphorylase [Sulfuricurvum sp.]|jgi:starch phosphorylase